MRQKSKGNTEALVLSHLSGIKRALLEGEKRPAFLEFLGGLMIAAGFMRFTTEPAPLLCGQGFRPATKARSTSQ